MSLPPPCTKSSCFVIVGIVQPEPNACSRAHRRGFSAMGWTVSTAIGLVPGERLTVMKLLSLFVLAVAVGCSGSAAVPDGGARGGTGGFTAGVGGGSGAGTGGGGGHLRNRRQHGNRRRCGYRRQLWNGRWHSGDQRQFGDGRQRRKWRSRREGWLVGSRRSRGAGRRLRNGRCGGCRWWLGKGWGRRYGGRGSFRRRLVGALGHGGRQSQGPRRRR